MTLRLLKEFEEKTYIYEYKRLKNLGYTDEDASNLAFDGINSKMTNLLLLLLLKQGSKK